MISDYKPSLDEIDLMFAYQAKGWTFTFEANGCHVGGWDDCVVTSPRITFEVNVDLDGWRKPLTEQRLLDEEAYALAAMHDPVIESELFDLKEDIREQLSAIYRKHERLPESITKAITVNLSLS